MLQYNPTVSGSLTITGSLTVTNGVIGTVSGVDIQIFSSSINQVISGIQGSTGSSDEKFNTLSGVTSSALTRLTNIESKSASVDISISNINSITSSFSPRVSNLESKSSSVDISISNINSVTASNIARLSNLETKSSSVDISISSINTFTSSNANTSLNSKTGSYATTGSNQFYGTQVFSGSVYIANDLVVQGSSSIQYISASSVSIGTNIVQLNTANPSVRFAGLSIIDSGSVGGSGSFLYDSLQDEFIFVHRGNGTNVTSSHFVLGPETYDSLGNETYLTCNVLTKGTGKEHLVDSCIFDNGTTTCIKNNLVGTGTACFTGNTIVSTSGNTTLTINGTSGVPALSFINTGGTNNIYGGVGSTANITIAPGDVNAVKIFAVGCVSCFAGVVCVPNIISTGASGGRYATFSAPVNGGYITFDAGGTAFGDIGSYCAQYGTGDATTLLLGSRTGYALALGTNSTERLRITCAGNVVIGKTTSAGGKLQVSNGTVTFNVDHNADGPYLTGATDNNVSYRTLSYDASEHIFLISATAKMRITSGGVVSINQTCGYSVFNLTGTDCGWGEGMVINPAPNGYSAIHFRLEGRTGSCVTCTWQLGKETSGSGFGELISLNKQGLTGGKSYRADASQQWKTNGDSVFGFNVGMGTCGPNARLTVWTPSTTGMQTALRLNNPFGFANANTGAKIVFSQDRSCSEDIPMGEIGVGQEIGATSSYGYMAFSTLGTTMSEKVRISSAGYIGIGTCTPEYPIHIYRCANIGMKIQTCGSTFASPSLNLLNGGVDTVLSATNSGLEIGTWSSNDILIKTGTVERMRITSGGIIYALNPGVDGTYQPMIGGMYSANNNETNLISTAVSSVASQSGFRFDVSNGAGSSARTTSMTINRSSVSVVGSFSANSKSFLISHPLTNLQATHKLRYVSVESPQADLIYRGKIGLINGIACINIDCSARMTEGTFETLNRCIQVFTTNESSWDNVKGKVCGNTLIIESQNINSEDEVSWMVIGERQDQHMYETDWTDNCGRVITEPELAE